MSEQQWKDEDAELERDYERREALEREDIVLEALNGWAQSQGFSRTVKEAA